MVICLAQILLKNAAHVSLTCLRSAPAGCHQLLSKVLVRRRVVERQANWLHETCNVHKHVNVAGAS